MTTSNWGVCLVLGLFIGGVTAAHASSTFDGSWGVSVHSKLSKCEGSSYFAFRVENGKVIAASGDASVSGHVSENGQVRVNIRHSDGHGASGSGHLAGAKGIGTWRGQRSAILCSGSWEAQRM
jgi:hypothetical protein